VVRRFADGAIFTKPTMTDVGLVGEAGAEAIYSSGRDTGIFPLTNRKYTGPFAAEIADQVARMSSHDHNGVNVTINGVAGPDETAEAVVRTLRLYGYE
jgi:ribosomal protein S11